LENQKTYKLSERILKEYWADTHTLPCLNISLSCLWAGIVQPVSDSPQNGWSGVRTPVG